MNRLERWLIRSPRLRRIARPFARLVNPVINRSYSRNPQTFWTELATNWSGKETPPTDLDDQEMLVVRKSMTVRHVLEVGCGYGRFLLHVRAQHEAVGVDFAMPQLRYAKTLTAGTNTELVCASASKLPFRESAFELTFTVGVLKYLSGEELRVVLEEAVRVTSEEIMHLETDPARASITYRHDLTAEYGGLDLAIRPENGWIVVNIPPTR